MITVLVDMGAVSKQVVGIPLEKKGNRDPLASRSLAAFARFVGHPKVIIQGDGCFRGRSDTHMDSHEIQCEKGRTKDSVRGDSWTEVQKRDSSIG